MTNEEAFEKLFGISIKQFIEMPQENIARWAKETNQILWGGFNGPKHNLNLKAVKNIISWN